MKPGAFTQIYVHIVISSRYKNLRMTKPVRIQVYKIMGGILNEYGHKPIIINGVEDHAHIFFGLNPNMKISDTVKEIKKRTTLFINNEGFFKQRFRWQAGYGAFSYSKSHIANVIAYIERQEEHHQRKSFEKEYRRMLKLFDINYDERYLFRF